MRHLQHPFDTFSYPCLEASCCPACAHSNPTEKTAFQAHHTDRTTWEMGDLPSYKLYCKSISHSTFSTPPPQFGFLLSPALPCFLLAYSYALNPAPPSILTMSRFLPLFQKKKKIIVQTLLCKASDKDNLCPNTSMCSRVFALVLCRLQAKGNLPLVSIKPLEPLANSKEQHCQQQRPSRLHRDFSWTYSIHAARGQAGQVLDSSWG